MSKKRRWWPILLLAATLGLNAVEAGFIIGPISDPKSIAYGLSAGSGMLVPLIKIEIEGFKVMDEVGTTLTAGIKVRPKFGKFAPYGLLGAGMWFETFNFDFSEYKFFTFFGGGIHLFPVSILSLRLDIRLLNFSEQSRLRISAGFFVHL